MTSQTKKFLELSDVLSLRFECKHCQSGLLVSSLRDLEKREEHGRLNNCPVCGRLCASVNGSMCELAIAKFLGALNELRRIIGTFPAGVCADT
jgi:transcription elongation factor Elf1